MVLRSVILNTPSTNFKLVLDLTGEQYDILRAFPSYDEVYKRNYDVLREEKKHVKAASNNEHEMA